MWVSKAVHEDVILGSVRELGVTGVREWAQGECVTGPRSCRRVLSLCEQACVNDRHPRPQGYVVTAFGRLIMCKMSRSVGLQLRWLLP